jgi:hypothetical protein
MGRRMLRIAGAALLSLGAAACNNATTLPDAQIRAPGGRLNDGGLGLGPGGIMPPPPGDSTNTATSNTSTTETTCVSLGGLGLGPGGRAECP